LFKIVPGQNDSDHEDSAIQR